MRVAALSWFIAKTTDKCHTFFQALKGGKNIVWNDQYEAAFQKLKEYLRSSPLLSKPKVGEDLYMYLAISERAVSAILVREEERV